ncbi:hypothetical protein Bca101_086283 [Brassica carinata]
MMVDNEGPRAAGCRRSKCPQRVEVASPAEVTPGSFCSSQPYTYGIKRFLQPAKHTHCNMMMFEVEAPQRLDVPVSRTRFASFLLTCLTPTAPVTFLRYLLVSDLP